MRAVVQRVSRAAVDVDGSTVGRIGVGLLVFLGIAHGDDDRDAQAMATKLAGLRVFGDAEGRMNLAVGDVEGAVLLVSQFTLLADVGRGRRPSFVGAADPEVAEQLIERVVEMLQMDDLHVEVGRFGERMEVSLVNEGPVTIVIEVADGRVRSLVGG